MNKNVKMMGKIGGAGLVGLMAVGAGQAAAADFNVTAEVQNTLEITVVQDMNLGTLFAAQANSGEAAALVLSAAGDMAPGTALTIDGGADAPSFLSLGGAEAARGSVATDTDFTITLPTGSSADDLDATAAGFEGVDNSANDVIEVRIAGGDPAVARFFLADFVIGDLVGGEETVDGTDPSIYDVNPDFGVTEVEFGIGATIYTDGSGERDAYEAGTYEGTFEVTAEF